MKRNALDVTEEVVYRIDGTPALGEFIDARKSPLEDDQFFFNKEYIQNRNADTPGAAYFQKVCDFYDSHYTRGELYVEYVKDCCFTRTGQQCQFCQRNSWTSTKKFMGIPAPYLDTTKLPKFKYEDVFETSLYKGEVNKIFRAVDDFLPRAQLKVEFSAGTVRIEDPNSIKKFSEKYVVEEDHVRSYLNHLLCLQRARNIRTNQRKRDKAEVKNKSYEDYDWVELSSSRDTLIKKLTVKELEKYLNFHKLSLKGLKNDKITWIMAHINFSTNGSNMHSQYESVSQNDQQQEETEKGDSEDDDVDSEDDDCKNEILAVFGSDSEDEDSHEESEDDSDDMNVPQIYQGSTVFTSRSGRQYRPSSRYQDFLA